MARLHRFRISQSAFRNPHFAIRIWFPMLCPPYGVCLPCRVEKVHDGDTVHVRVYDPKTGHTGLTVLQVRLLDCWAPELKSKVAGEAARGLKAKEFLESLLADEDKIAVFIPLQPGWSILSITTLGRVLGRLFIGTEEVAPIMIRHGHATAKKPAARKEESES